MPYDVVERKDGGLNLKLKVKTMRHQKFQRVFYKKSKQMQKPIWVKL